MQLPAGFAITPMRENELGILGEWAAAEGWNPGHSDLAIAWQTDPQAFVALREGDRLAGGGSIYSYDGLFGFMGLFIMRADLRRQGLGATLWHWRQDTLLQRLRSGATIGMDGVFNMVPFYERGGFKPAYRDLRYQGIAAGRRSPRCNRRPQHRSRRQELHPGIAVATARDSRRRTRPGSTRSRRDAVRTTRCRGGRNAG